MEVGFPGRDGFVKDEMTAIFRSSASGQRNCVDDAEHHDKCGCQRGCLIRWFFSAHQSGPRDFATIPLFWAISSSQVINDKHRTYHAGAPLSDPSLLLLYADRRPRCVCLRSSVSSVNDSAFSGRILIAWEGLNGTVSGESAATRSTTMEAMREDPRFQKMAFKVDPAEGHAFPRLSVKARGEVVTLGLDPRRGHRSERNFGKKSSSRGNGWRCWRAVRRISWCLTGGIPTRLISGAFKGRSVRRLSTFGDFPKWFEEHRSELEGKNG